MAPPMICKDLVEKRSSWPCSLPWAFETNHLKRSTGASPWFTSRVERVLYRWERDRCDECDGFHSQVVVFFRHSVVPLLLHSEKRAGPNCKVIHILRVSSTVRRGGQRRTGDHDFNLDSTLD